MELPSSSNSEGSSKLYVGRLTGDVSEVEIRDYFASKFGEVKDLVLLRDRATGERRGYAFVEFADPGSAAAALKEVEHEIAGKKVIVNKVRRRDQQRRNYQSAQDQNPAPGIDVNTGLNNSSNAHSNNGNTPKFKIFVGGVSSSTSEEDFKSYFEHFGTITDAVLMYDRDTGRRRGFGFITFDSRDALDKVLQDKYHELKDKRVEVRKAVPWKVNNNNLVAHCGSNYDSDGGRGKEPVDDYHCRCVVLHDPRCVWQNHTSAYASFHEFYGTCIYGGGYACGGYGEIYNPRIPCNGLGVINQTYGNAATYASYPNLGINGCMAGTGGYGHPWVPTNDISGYSHRLEPDNGKLIQSANNIQITEMSEETTVVESSKSDAQQSS